MTIGIILKIDRLLIYEYSRLNIFIGQVIIKPESAE